MVQTAITFMGNEKIALRLVRKERGFVFRSVLAALKPCIARKAVSMMLGPSIRFYAKRCKGSEKKMRRRKRNCSDLMRKLEWKRLGHHLFRLASPLSRVEARKRKARRAERERREVGRGKNKYHRTPCMLICSMMFHTKLIKCTCFRRLVYL